MNGRELTTFGKIICVGLNYRDHAIEQKIDLPTRPILFAKWPNSLSGPGIPIRIPPITSQVDYEAELAVVIGERCRRVPANRALEVVSGYAALNDVSARDLQFGDGQWSRGKSLDGFCPIGPVTESSAISDPQALRIRAELNGRTMQDSTTAEMVFGITELLAFITQGITLEPGDVIATGTPAGVGVFREPPVFLRNGDEITIRIDGLSPLTNPVVSGEP